jgi:hypothetical protein
MSDENEMLEKLRESLWKSPLVFCIVYREVTTISAGFGLRWRWAISPGDLTRADYDEVAGSYQDAATDCFQNRRDLARADTSTEDDSGNRQWCARTMNAGPKGELLPTNSIGQRWWHVVIGSGATRDAGYVIAAKIAAKDAKDVAIFIDEIQNVLSSEK